MDSKKRTRSQTTLDAFVSVNLARSPLKQARSALRHTPPHRPAPPQPHTDSRPRSTSPDNATEGKLKRPLSPGKDAAVHHERDFKRARHNLAVFPRRPSAHTSDHPPQQSSSAYRRAVSVPAISSVVPLLDLNNVPPSPRRSPTKFRIASVPPESKPPDQPLPALQLTIQPPSPSIPPERAFLRTEASKSDQPLPALQVTQLSIRPPSPVIPPEPQHESPPSPLSPLSPLPLTEDELMPVDPAPAPSTSNSTSTATSESKAIPMPTSESRPSRLPVSSIVSRMKPKTPAPAKKARSKAFAPSVRTTRSTALRQKKVEEEAKTKAHPAAGPSATPHRRRSMSLSSYAQPTAASSAKASPVKPSSSRPSTVAPPSGAFTFTSTPRMSNLLPGAAGSSRPRPPGSSTGTSTGTLQLNSSLSTLNQALERLNAPAPTRASTSMGFHRDRPSGESEDDGDRTALRSSTGESGRPGSALAGKALASVKPLAAHGKEVKTMKTMKQTTLMLPPPLPAPDTVKARGVPLTEKSMPATNARKDHMEEEEDPREDARKKQVSLALAPSMGKLRNSLGFALPPSTPSARPALPTPSSSAARTSTGALPQKRVFPAATPSGGRALFGGIPAPSGSGSGITKIGPPTGARSSLGAGRGGLGFGLGARTSLGMGARRGGMATRVLQRASKKSSLPVVIGSPVKGGARADVAAEEDVMDVSEEGGEGEKTTQEKIGDWLRNASADVLRDLGHTEEEGADAQPQHEDTSANGAVVDGQPSSDAAGPPPSSEGEGSAESAAREAEREREREARRNASRRASMASQLLSQSLSALPDTPPGAVAAKDKGKGRAMSSSWPVPGEQVRRPEGTQSETGAGAGEMPPPPVPPARATRHNTRQATGALATPPSRPPEPSGSKGKEKEKGVQDSPGALAVLRGCTIFVDVRTEEGDDAGGLFVDMLRGLGAKMATRVGSRCTHVVYKNGLMSTLTRYRLVKDPKPLVVGIAWVVECVEKRQRVEETRFLVDLAMANVAGVNRRRKSMLPKSIFASPGADGKTGGGGAGAASGPAVSPASSSDSSFRANGPAADTSMGRFARGFAGDRSTEVSSPTGLAGEEDADSSMQSNGGARAGGDRDGEESLPPLEKARRRRSMLPAR
ncbi:hypothetical protein TRAPUB_7249 [Trametes pubescens]|uniref:BRCT domain-containing protein n=1 Tax=Trametes pubescens TaxID=154538 RepID=A0A1M2V3Q0_TRAPU|nr:hypothetical protein TRAPUB_7249 [Trametes pubescens]